MNSYPRRRRYRRNREPSGVLQVVIVLGFAALLAVLFVFSPIGEVIHQKLLVPIAQSIEQWKEKRIPKGPVAEVLAQNTLTPTALPTEEPVHTDVFSVTANPFYILQMGEYDSKEDADLSSAKIRAMGGGGYVFDRDGTYRLFAAAYADADSLKSVQQQIRRDGFVNEAYITDSKTVQITLKGVPEAIAIFENAAEVFQQIPDELTDLALRFDKGEWTNSEVELALAKLRESVESALNGLSKIDSEDIEPMRQALIEYQNTLSTFLESHDTMKQDHYAGALKHLQLASIDAYLHFFEGT